MFQLEVEYSIEDMEKINGSCYFYNARPEKRKFGCEYCLIKVVGCRDDFWYKNLIGLIFFCRIYRDSFGEIKEFNGIKLTDTTETLYRRFMPYDVKII